MNIIINKYKNLPVAVKLTVWTFICLCVQKGISVLSVPLFTRIMSTEQYGQYNAYLSWEAVFEIFVSFRLYAGVYDKGMNKYKDRRDEYALSMQYTCSVLTIICVSIYLILYKFINQLTGLSTLITVAMFIELFLCTPMKFWSVKKRYEFDYKSIVIATMILALLNPVVGILVVYVSNEKGLARILSLIVVNIIYGLVFYVINIVKGRWKYRVDLARFAIKFNAPLLPHYFSEYILNSSDKIMIQKIIGYSEVGLYSVAYSAGMLLTIVTTSINQALVPWLYQEMDKSSFKRINTVICSIGFIVLLPLTLFILLAPELVLLLAGDVYSQSVYVIPPVCASIFFLFWYTLCANVEFYYDKNKFTMFISLIGALVNVFLNLVFIPLFGYLAAGYTTLFSYMVYGIGHMIFMEKVFFKKEGKRLFNAKVYIPQMVCILFVCIGANFIYGYLWIRIISICTIFIVLFLLKNKIKSIIREVKR